MRQSAVNSGNVRVTMAKSEAASTWVRKRRVFGRALATRWNMIPRHSKLRAAPGPS